ncbi:hypothetical protein HED49_03345 [Ochrobactrum daejeonense]|nr:hypothetical protein [Brucella daejeonensis]
MFGIKGDGSNENTLLQGMFDFAAGKEVVLPYGATYGISTITLPIGMRLKAKGASFNKLVASTSYAINIPGYVTFDNIILSTPGGGSDMGIRINGDFVAGEVIQSIATAEASGFAVRIEGPSAAARIGNVRIAKITAGNFSSQIQAFYVSRLWIGDMRMTNYVTGFYIRDVVISQFDNILASGLHSAATGGAGNNGVLLESVDGDYGTDNVTFGKVTVKDSAEHAVRIGGQFIMRDIHFDKISAFNTGSLGNTSTGGAAFKALLGDTNPGRHENITVDNLYFEDCSDSTNGIRNHAAVHISRCNQGYVNNIVGRRNNKAYSCKIGILIIGSNRFHFDNPDIIYAANFGFNAAAESLQDNISNVTVNGGILHSAQASPVCYFEPDADATFTRVNIKGTVLYGGRTAARYNDPTGTGNYVNCSFDADYSSPVATPSGGVVEVSNPGVQMTLRTNIPTPVGASPANGSTWQDYGRGEFYVRRAGNWVAA